MATQERGFITVDSVINDYMEEAEKSIHSYVRLYNIAYRGMENMGLDFFYQIKSIKVAVDTTNMTALLPDDFLSYTKIGVLNPAGEVIPLKFNQKLTTYADLMPNRAQKTEDTTLLTWYNQGLPIFYNYWDGYGFANIYGVPSGSPNVGSFNIDEKNGVILLNQNFFYEYLMIEYVSAPSSENNYMIPVQFREALVAWIAWRDIANAPSSRRGNLGDKRDRKVEFGNQRRLAIARYKPIYLEQAYYNNSEAQRLTVKA
jgi:hypothetical protein